MLILPHAKLLNDGRLNMTDALTKFKEKVYDAQDKYRLPDQEHLTNAVARIGIPMSSDEFIRRVLKLNNNLWVEDSWGWSKGVNFYTTKNNTKVCCGSPFEKGFMPEFDIIHVDERNFPTGKTPGWRGVLKQLISNGFLKKLRVDRAFGVPSINETSTRWFQSTQRYNT